MKHVWNIICISAWTGIEPSTLGFARFLHEPRRLADWATQSHTIASSNFTQKLFRLKYWSPQIHINGRLHCYLLSETILRKHNGATFAWADEGPAANRIIPVVMTSTDVGVCGDLFGVPRCIYARHKWKLTLTLTRKSRASSGHSKIRVEAEVQPSWFWISQQV